MRGLVAALVIGAGSVVAAQTAVPAQLPTEVGEQVRQFEDTLRTAIGGAAGRLATRARQVVPDVTLQFLTGTRVTSLILPDGTGYMFITEAPAIEATSAMFFEAYQRMNQARMVANPGAAPSVTAPVAAGFPKGPIQEYSSYVRQALIDAILDNTRALPINDGQTLTVVETGGQPANPNPLEDSPRKLYLQIKGADLLALRLNRIDREEAKKRIIETVR